jgi:hypothetical protein
MISVLMSYTSIFSFLVLKWLIFKKNLKDKMLMLKLTY